MMPETALLPVLLDLIRVHGSITVGQYMALCLGHPQYGYYMRREPFGSQGDFTTAPEISQLYGEMVAVWIMAMYRQMGSPETIQLVELGPGRGTLMKDIIRGIAAMPELKDALAIYLVEFSPRLRNIQRETLQGLDITWHESIDMIPLNASIIIANEFFDALPVNQAVYHDKAWHERVITRDEGDLLFGLGAKLNGIYAQGMADGAIYEYAPLVSDTMAKLCAFLKQNAGAMLIADYGDTIKLDHRIGETLQALYNQKPDDVLAHPGEADLTAHVAFAALRDIAAENGLNSLIQTQREFLTEHGIRLRADRLKAGATTEQAETLQTGLHRLIDPAGMGDLFKVMQVWAS